MRPTKKQARDDFFYLRGPSQKARASGVRGRPQGHLSGVVQELELGEASLDPAFELWVLLVGPLELGEKMFVGGPRQLDLLVEHKENARRLELNEVQHHLKWWWWWWW